MNDEQAKPPGLQFGLRHLIVATAVLSVLFALLFHALNWVASATTIVTSTLAAAGLTTVIVYGSGDLRAFCIGAIFPVMLTAIPTICLFVIFIFGGLSGGYPYMFSELGRYSAGMRSAMIAGIVLAPIAGILSVILRRRLLS